jgi:transposase
MIIGPPSGTRIWLVAGHTDLRKGVDGLSALVQNHLSGNPFTGEVYLFRGKSGNKIKVLWATPDGMNFLYKRLNDAKFVWPQVRDGTVCLSAAQLSMLLEGIDWRHPKRTGLSPEDPDRTRPTRT